MSKLAPHVSGGTSMVVAPDDRTDLLGLVEAETRSAVARAERGRQRGVVVGTIEALDGNGAPQIAYAGSPAAPPTARSVVPLAAADVGRSVVVDFEEGDPNRPIVIGVLQFPPGQVAAILQTRVDGQTVTINAEREIVLKCGDASITLTRAGKVIIRGTHVSSRSSGANRIKGASVEVN